MTDITIADAQSRLSISSGQLLANPIPAKYSIPLRQMNRIIADAVRDANGKGITGSDNTPYVLRKIRDFTDGKSVDANRALIVSNVIMGTEVAIELSKLESRRRGSRR